MLVEMNILIAMDPLLRTLDFYHFDKQYVGTYIEQDGVSMQKKPGHLWGKPYSISIYNENVSDIRKNIQTIYYKFSFWIKPCDVMQFPNHV